MAFSMKSCSTSKSPIITFFNIKTALFHSTPLLERRRPSNWGFGGGYNASTKKRYNYSRRSRKMHSKHTLLRNVNEFAEHLFQSWRFYDYEDFDDPSSSKGSSWFRGQNWGKRKKRNKYGSQKPQWGNHKSRGGFNFCFEDDEDVEVIFRSAFGAERGTYWSFIHDDSSQWSSSYTNNRKSWKWRSRYEDEYESYKDYNDDLESDVASDRLALGLSASGPLKLEDVKNAYRTCALKWHPDRHQGSSKAEAEEKFKLCSAAYQSLCDKLE